jgi:hypothetical protein
VAHVADAGARFLRLQAFKHLDRPKARPQQSGQNAQQRRLAGAVFADQHVAAARLEIDRHLAQRGKRAKQPETPTRLAQSGCCLSGAASLRNRGLKPGLR